MDARFHPAQAALAVGDTERLASLLVGDPGLATARSQCDHPTILQCLVLTMPPVDNLEDLIDLLAEHSAELTDPLVAASGIDNVRAMARLLDLGAQIEGNGRWSPLEEALYWGNEAAVALLLERGARVHNLRTAAALGELEWITRCFDDAGALTAAAGEVASPFQKIPIPEHVRREPQQILANALVHAAAWGRAEAVDELIRRGAQVNLIPAGFDFAGTPLHYAALRGRRDMVDHLLQLGADPAVRDTKIGKLPEDWAAHDGHKDLSEYLQLVRKRAE
ncbi:MAG TPA: ankyrin repeat domain-containing protein [Isosphaeraceae bacterium]|nr:ankyrin repeat domain-containing protein [Isosphaeraceae bacterium]